MAARSSLGREEAESSARLERLFGRSSTVGEGGAHSCGFGGGEGRRRRKGFRKLPAQGENTELGAKRIAGRRGRYFRREGDSLLTV